MSLKISLEMYVLIPILIKYITYWTNQIKESVDRHNESLKFHLNDDNYDNDESTLENSRCNVKSHNIDYKETREYIDTMFEIKKIENIIVKIKNLDNIIKTSKSLQKQILQKHFLKNIGNYFCRRANVSDKQISKQIANEYTLIYKLIKECEITIFTGIVIKFPVHERFNTDDNCYKWGNDILCNFTKFATLEQWINYSENESNNKIRTMLHTIKLNIA